MNEEEFKKEVEEAKRRVHNMDKIDGWKDRLPSTIYLALKAGIKNPQGKSHFDALVMLEEVVMKTMKK